MTAGGPVSAVGYAVDTAELVTAADRLQASAVRAGRHRALLQDLAGEVDGWSAPRSRTAAAAFLDTLTWAAEGASSGLSDLARRTAAAAGAYDRAEHSVPVPR